MAELLTVGEFSRLTHLTVKALHHYHEADVLPPAHVDAATGYRYYAPGQLADAQLLRRLRQVRMPLAEVRDVLAAADPAAREARIAGHLDRLRAELVATAAAVASLQALLTTTGPLPEIDYRLAPGQTCLARTEDVDGSEIEAWCASAFPTLFEAVTGAGLELAGPGGASYGEGWFELGGGTVTAYLPLSGPPAQEPRQPDVDVVTLPAGPVAVAMHAGPFTELDRTYAALGSHVLERRLGAAGPIHEIYLVSPADTTDPTGLRTEVCWPITHLPEER